MNKKRDLKIDTEFFDDNLNGLTIPQAILIAPSVSQQNLMKSGLNQDDSNYQLSHSHDNISYSTEIIQKIMSRKLVDHFIWCWQKLKHSGSIIDEKLRSNFSQSKHRRLSPQVYNIALEEGILLQAKTQQSDLARDRLAFPKVNSSGEGSSRLEWLNQKPKIDIVNSKRIIITKKRTNDALTDQLQMQRANILKQIVQKLKKNRTEANDLSGQVQHISKVDKLQRLVQNMNWNPHQCCQLPNKNTKNIKSLKDSGQQQQITDQIILQFANLRRDIQELRKQNQHVLKKQTKDRDQFYQILAKKQQQNMQQIYRSSLKQELSKKQELKKIDQTKLQIQKTYQILHQQIANFEKQKITNPYRLNNQQLMSHFQTQKYESQISKLQSKLHQLQTTKLKQHIPYLRNHSQYYQQILNSVPQNNKIIIQRQPIQYSVNQSNIPNNIDLVSKSQFELGLQRQKFLQDQRPNLIYPQEYQGPCYC